MLPGYRKKRPYLSSILAKNEVSRSDPYNRKLFLRIRTGHYVLHPDLAIRIAGDWKNVYALFNVESFLRLIVGFCQNKPS